MYNKAQPKEHQLLSHTQYKYPHFYINGVKHSCTVPKMADGKRFNVIYIAVHVNNKYIIAYGSCRIESSVQGPASHISFSPDVGSVFAFVNESKPVEVSEMDRGGWSHWEVACHNPCGTEYQKSRRTCNNPLPHPLSMGCHGHSRRFLECNNKPCDDEKLK